MGESAEGIRDCLWAQGGRSLCEGRLPERTGGRDWSGGCADAEAPVAGPHPANACRPPSAPCGVGAGPTSWTAIPAWQPLDGHALPTRRTSPASRRPPRMGTRHPIPLLPTGKPLRGTTPLMMMIGPVSRHVLSFGLLAENSEWYLVFADQPSKDALLLAQNVMVVKKGKEIQFRVRSADKSQFTVKVHWAPFLFQISYYQTC